MGELNNLEEDLTDIINADSDHEYHDKEEAETGDRTNQRSQAFHTAGKADNVDQDLIDIMHGANSSDSQDEAESRNFWNNLGDEEKQLPQPLSCSKQTATLER